MLAFATTIFWAAFLLFVVQPLTARRLLPAYGGSPTVWIVTLVFFQVTLVAGYAYAHGLVRLLAGRAQAVVHAVVALGALFVLLAGVETRGLALPRTEPAREILTLLVRTLGVPVFALAASGPLLQRWLVPALVHATRRRVYRLFALSNLGSLLGLWCYPFLLEPFVSLASQRSLWAFGYGIFVMTTLWCARTVFHSSIAPMPSARLAEGVSARALWVLLSGTGAAMLMATSNQLTRNVAAVPFLWVLPLSLYLVSFILCFERDRWYVRPIWASVFVASLAAVLQLLSEKHEPGLRLQLVVYSVNLFSGCMVCHGELARRRPRVRGLTTFYLYVAVGGALGGLWVSLAAPQLFSGYWEFPLALLAVYVLGGVSARMPPRGRVAWAAGGVFLAILLTSYVRRETEGALLMRRSFYGVVRVYESFTNTAEWERYLWNGPIAHGGELMAPGRRGRPILYYGEDTGVALALRFESERPKRVGIVGLGTGSLAAYGREGDVYRFYELNPDVVDVARQQFDYLATSQADIEIEIGDGRLLLAEDTHDDDFDVLVLDAFTGDAIPIHLLTEEAFAVYERRLSPGGILAVHVSNLHFDLEPVVRAQAEHRNLVSVLVQSDADEARHQFVSDWVLVTANANLLADPAIARHFAPRVHRGEEDARDYLWTDDHANLFHALR